jgi:hypothetical protein
MSPDMARSIINLINVKGPNDVMNVIDDDSKNHASGTPRFLGIFSREFIGDNDFEDVYRGFGTLALAAIRKPKFGGDEYQVILQDAFSLPSELAEPIAKKIESYDILNPVKNGVDPSIWRKFTEQFKEGVRRTINWTGQFLQTPWEVDQGQDYDLDFLFELKMLGQAVGELNSRSNLMTGQVQIQQSMGLLETGDIEDGDVDSYDQMVGDVFGRAGGRRLPHSVFGGLSRIGHLGHHASMRKASDLATMAGIETKHNGKPSPSSVHPSVKAAVGNILKKKAPMALMTVATGGTAPLLKKGLAMIRKHGDIYSQLDTNHGASVANAWEMGDIDSLAEEILATTHGDFETGDPELDHQIENILAGDPHIAMGDVRSKGKFRQFKINHLKKKLGRLESKQGGQQQQIQQQMNSMEHEQPDMSSGTSNFPTQEDISDLEQQNEDPSGLGTFDFSGQSDG